MSDLSPRLGLPYLQPSQAQKHVTHNEALLRLDALVQLAVADFGETVPPASPAAGQIHALGASATADWAGQDGKLALWDGTAWQFIDPQEGWRAVGLAQGDLRVYSGATWSDILQNVAGLGIGTGSDAANPLAVAGPASLFTHAGDDHRIKVNKAGAGDTASLLFQSGWSGRAELGLTGSDDFALKVSADGGSFHTALSVDQASGKVAFPSGADLGTVITVPEGRYVKFADGTMLAELRIDMGPGNIYGDGTLANMYRSGNVDLTWAEPFIQAPIVGLAAESDEAAGNHKAIFLSFRSVSATGMDNLQVFRTTSGTRDVTAHVTLQGRWA